VKILRDRRRRRHEAAVVLRDPIGVPGARFQAQIAERDAAAQIGSTAPGAARDLGAGAKNIALGIEMSEVGKQVNGAGSQAAADLPVHQPVRAPAQQGVCR
jgi:hypothetical protein